MIIAPSDNQRNRSEYSLLRSPAISYRRCYAVSRCLPTSRIVDSPVQK
ncbi:hypothetical protein EVA_02934 [gut metagenome]|uniref:Uncharacterized protein n=1 Tax=gut metagenome TaxID=749906 RepID=J9GMZ7_9ZZZZ